MDNKISFLSGWFLTTATTAIGMGLFRAALLGLVGGFFGLLGKQLYYYVKGEVLEAVPKVKVWIQKIKTEVLSWVKK